MLPTFLAAAEQLRQGGMDTPILVARAPDLAADAYVCCPPDLLAPAEEVARRARAAITKSGTITLQLAIADVPMVVAYRVHGLTFRILRRLVTLDNVALVNLVADDAVVAECLQDEMTPQRLAREVGPLLDDGERRREVLRGLAEVRGRLGQPGAAARVADACVAHLDRAGAL